MAGPEIRIACNTTWLCLQTSRAVCLLNSGCGLPADELQLPLQERTLTQLDMSAIERHFYSIQHEVSCPAVMLHTDCAPCRMAAFRTMQRTIPSLALPLRTSSIYPPSLWVFLCVHAIEVQVRYPASFEPETRSCCRSATRMPVRCWTATYSRWCSPTETPPRHRRKGGWIKGRRPRCCSPCCASGRPAATHRCRLLASPQHCPRRSWTEIVDLELRSLLLQAQARPVDAQCFLYRLLYVERVCRLEPAASSSCRPGRSP